MRSHTRRSLAALTAAFALSALLTGCDTPQLGLPVDPSAESQPGDREFATGSAATGSMLYERTIVLTDGRSVTCIAFIAGSQGGGISCDWDSANGLVPPTQLETLPQ